MKKQVVRNRVMENMDNHNMESKTMNSPSTLWERSIRVYVMIRVAILMYCSLLPIGMSYADIRRNAAQHAQPQMETETWSKMYAKRLLPVMNFTILRSLESMKQDARNCFVLAQTDPIPQSDPLAQRRQQILQEYHSYIEPLIAEMTEKNKAARDRAIEQFQKDFGVFYHGMGDFADSLLGPIDSLTTWWGGEEQIQAKWNEYVISEEKLQQVILNCVDQFNSDLEINLNEFRSKLEFYLAANNWKPLETADTVDSAIDKITVDSAIDEILLPQVFDDVKKNIALNVAYGTLDWLIIQRVINAAVTRIGIGTGTKFIAPAALGSIGLLSGLGATSVAVPAGVMASLVTSSAAAGSVVPGVGTIIGLGVGFVAGACIDAYAEADILLNSVQTLSETKNKVSASLNENLTKFIVDLNRSTRKNIQNFLLQRLQNQAQLPGEKVPKSQENLIQPQKSVPLIGSVFYDITV